jgi:Polyketide cyclase / dehydrase and lipid transport
MPNTAPTVDPSATSTVEIAAEPSTVYALLTDLATLADLAEETAAMRWTKGDGVRPGAVFKGTNRNGWRRWTTTCTVTAAEPGRAFAFDVSHTGFPVARWRYDIAPTASGCTVTESTWDRRPAWFKLASAPVTGVADRTSANAGHIEATLRRLKARAENEATASK